MIGPSAAHCQMTKGFRLNERASKVVLVVTSFSILKTTSVLVCPAGHRISRPPPPRRRPRDRATPAPHNNPPINRCPRRKKGHGRRTRLEGGVDWCPPRDGLLAALDGGGLRTILLRPVLKVRLNPFFR